mmetsp:Transcript_5633/g.13452  ORF Transcript_5633/g.13452 Transcript_5633/m.13452 type:complete len:493 (-) Transcript_5633:148-1626(-)
MNKVVSSYFDEAHRSLQSNRESPGFSGAQHLQLPPLRTNSPPSDTAETLPEKSSLRPSASLSMLEYSDKATRGIMEEKYQQALQDNARLNRKLRTLQDQYAVTSAKKEAFKAQAVRLEREFKKGHEASDSMQRDLIDARREAEQTAKEAREAVAMMSDMRKSHIQEVRLLQRGLAARGGDEKFRNRVNEVADLVDKLGRAVVQRDEAVRDKTKAQAHLNEAISDVRHLTDERAKLRKQNGQMREKLEAAMRKVKIIEAQPDQEAMNVDDSDEEFEVELHLVERRIEILKDNAAGADILASNLDKEKEQLRQKLKQEQETIQMLERSVDYWMKTCGERDAQILDLNSRIETILKHQAVVDQQIAKKKNSIAEDVDEERERLEKRIAELETERDAAQSAVEGMQKASDRLTQELVNVHEKYADNWQRKKEEARQIAAAKMGEEGQEAEEDEEAAEDEPAPEESGEIAAATPAIGEEGQEEKTVEEAVEGAAEAQ